MSDKSAYEILAEIQREINVPKSRYNDYGKFNYRSYEDIVEAVKPICHKHRTTLVVNDEIVQVESWHYVRATAALRFWDIEEVITSTAYAREQEVKKGSDASQITGMASTYARKYALCGLFSIDGQDDADAMNNTQNKNSKAVFWGLLQEEAARFGLDPMDGVNHMKTLDSFEESEDFYAGMVYNLKNDTMETMSQLFPKAIKED